jgi:hypothetical protein
MAIQDYRWAAGSGVALASLSNFENDVKPNNRKVAGGKLYPVIIESQPVNAFPVRTLALSGKERGDGIITHIWNVALAELGYQYILDTYLSSGAAVNAAMTIYTRRHDIGDSARYNANLTLPDPERGEVERLRTGVYRVVLRFTNLVAL